MFGLGKKKRPPVITIGGRQFRNVRVGENTIDHSIYYARVCKEAGLDRVSPKAGDETDEQYGQRLFSELWASGHATRLLGALVLPANKEERQWTPAMAEETAAFIGGLTDPADHQVVQSLVLTAWLSFFVAGMASSSPSRTSSTEDHPDQASESIAAPMRSATANGVA